MSFDDQSPDPRALQDLVEESQDCHSDAMRTGRESLSEFDPDETERFGTERRRLVRKSLVAGGALAAYGFGEALLRLLGTPAFADEALDVQMLQTSAAIENLAVAAYDTALALPFIGGDGSNPTLRAFVTKTKDQHAEHGREHGRRHLPG